MLLSSYYFQISVPVPNYISDTTTIYNFLLVFTIAYCCSDSNLPQYETQPLFTNPVLWAGCFLRPGRCFKFLFQYQATVWDLSTVLQVLW